MRRHLIPILLRKAPSLAARLLGAEPQGMAIDFTDMSMVIRDPSTPTNNFVGDPNSKLTYTSPPTKWVRGKTGLLVSGTALRTDYNDAGTALGIWLEPAITNEVASGSERDLTNGAWTKSNTTAAKDQVGVDGVANSASSLTATSTNGTCLQAITSGSSARTFSVFIKRVSGAGSLEITFNNGGAWDGSFTPTVTDYLLDTTALTTVAYVTTRRTVAVRVKVSWRVLNGSTTLLLTASWIDPQGNSKTHEFVNGSQAVGGYSAWFEAVIGSTAPGSMGVQATAGTANNIHVSVDIEGL